MLVDSSIIDIAGLLFLATFFKSFYSLDIIVPPSGSHEENIF